MRWKQGQYVRKKFKMPCPLCEYWLDVTVTLRYKEKKTNEIDKDVGK